MPTLSSWPADECPPADPLLASTLVLLTLYARTPTLAAADEIARSFAMLARHPGASEALQSTCTRLFLDWLGPLQTQDGGPDHAWREVHTEPLQMQ